MKKIRLLILVIIVFSMSHCEFQKSSAKCEKNYNKHLVSSDKYYNNFQYNDIYIGDCKYRIYFNPTSGRYSTKGGIAIVNITNANLIKQKLNLEIKLLKRRLNETNCTK